MSTTFSCDAEAIVKQALLQQGWLDYTATVDPTKQAQMLQAFNIMVKAWSSRGLKLWTIQDVTFPFVADQTVYTMGPSTADVTTDRPLRVEYALIRLNEGSNDIQLNALSRNEYEMLGNKFNTGTPNSFFYDPQIPNGELHIYLTPDQFTADNYTPHFFVRRQINDMTTISADVNFPSEWYQALYWGLAAETWLMNQIDPRVGQILELKAQKFMDEMEGWDREWADVTFGLDLSPGAYGQ